MTDYAHGKKLDRLEAAQVALKGEVQRLDDAHAALEGDVMVLKLAKADARSDLIELFRRMERLESKLAALEPPATPAPDPVCQYAGPNRKDRGGRTEGCISGCDWGLDDMFHHHPFCKGPSVPTADPEPVPLDPVLVLTDSEVEMLQEIVNARTSGTGGLIMSTQIDYREIAIGILGRTYGRDGAR